MWHKITRIDNGEVQIVESLDSFNVVDYHVEQIRSPNEGEAYDQSTNDFIPISEMQECFPKTCDELRQFIIRTMEENSNK